MTHIEPDKSPSGFITAIEGNLAAFLPVYGKLGESYEDDPPGIKRSITDIPMALFNSIMDAQLAPERVDATIEYIISDARKRKVPVLWWTGPSTRPVDLGKHHEDYGFELEDEAPGMAVDLTKLTKNQPEVEGLSIQLAVEEDAWRQWSYCMAIGFEVPSTADFVINGWQNLLRQADPDTILAYIGFLNNLPVATSLLFLGAGVAGIYSVATIPEARQRGVGARMTLHALHQASLMGFQIGILQSSRMGLGVYRSLGFQEYCTLNMYRWPRRDPPN